MKLAILDRDGVLNEMVVDPEHGTVDSPLHPRQVRVDPAVPGLLARLQRAGYGLCVATNQPAAAQGKTTLANLRAVHEHILWEVAAGGARILWAEPCFHRAEDGCDCRKPRTGLLAAAFAALPGAELEGSWMIGDGITDIQAGASFGLRTALVGRRRCDTCAALGELRPDRIGSLAELVDAIAADPAR